MKFQIKLDLMKDYLKRLVVAVQPIASRVELTGILISVFDNSIVFEGRNDNLDTRIEESSLSSVKIFETGRALIKANTLNEIVQRMEGDTVTFTKIDQNIVTIESKDSKYDMNLLTDENFERATYMEPTEEIFTISQKDFYKAVTKVIFAGKDKHSKFIYQGVNFNVENGSLSTTVCDGIRIASHKSAIAFEGRLNKIIPIVVIKELLKILPEKGEYKFSFSNNKGIVMAENMINQFALIEGTFPNFDKYFDESIYSKELIVNKQLLLKSVDRVTVLSLNKMDTSRVGLSIDSNEFKLESRELEIGSADVKIDQFNYNGEFIELSLSPKVIYDVLKASDSENVHIYMTNKDSSILLLSKEDKLIYLMSPMV